MEIKDRQKKRIIDWVGRIGSAATDEDEKRIEEGMDSMRRGPVAAVWDKVLFLWNTFRTDCPAQQKALIIGALAYLILPLDVIPDVLPFAGLIDDAFAVTYVFTAVRKLASKAVPAIEKKADTLIKENVYPLVRAELEGMHRRRLVSRSSRSSVRCRARQLPASCSWQVPSGLCTGLSWRYAGPCLSPL